MAASLLARAKPTTPLLRAARHHAGSTLHSPSLLVSRCRRAVFVKAEEERTEGGQGPLDSMESLFSKELKRRGIDNAETSSTEGASAADPFKAKTATQARPPPAWVDEDAGDQLSKSRQLNSEGLEGLVPRGSQLLQLGGSLFLSFLPFLVAISLLFGGIFLLLGDKFVHYGTRGAGMPQYIDPDLLLNEPTVDPFVTFRAPAEQMEPL